MNKTEEHLNAGKPKSWKIRGLGKVDITDMESRDDNLWVAIRSEDFPVDPDGYLFVNPPLKHEGNLDPPKALKQILGDAIRFYANSPVSHGDTTLTVFSDVADGRIASTDSTYALARSGNFLVVNTTETGAEGNPQVGQQLATDYFVYSGYYAFDTSPIGTATISAAVFSFNVFYDGSVTPFITELRLYDWGTTLTTADFVPGASMGSNPLLATLDANTVSTLNVYYNFVDVAGPANINKTGFTRIHMASDRTRNGNVPTGEERIVFYNADNTGTTQDPKLTVTYSSAASPAIVVATWIR